MRVGALPAESGGAAMVKSTREALAIARRSQRRRDRQPGGRRGLRRRDGNRALGGTQRPPHASRPERASIAASSAHHLAADDRRSARGALDQAMTASGEIGLMTGSVQGEVVVVITLTSALNRKRSCRGHSTDGGRSWQRRAAPSVRCPRCRIRLISSSRSSGRTGEPDAAVAGHRVVTPCPEQGSM